MKSLTSRFAALVSAVFLCAFPFDAGNGEPGRTGGPYEHTGVAKAKSQATHRLTVDTATGVLEFQYRRHGKRQCAGFKEIAVGDRIRIVAADRQPVSEATCVTKLEVGRE